MNKVDYFKDRELTQMEIIAIGSVFVRAIVNASTMYRDIAFIFRNGKYHFSLPTRVWVDADESQKDELEQLIAEHLSNDDCYNSFIVDTWPGVDIIKAGSCMADDCVIIFDGKVYLGRVSCDEWTFHWIRVRG